VVVVVGDFLVFPCFGFVENSIHISMCTQKIREKSFFMVMKSVSFEID
jgi:hypothetical protein